MVAGFGMTLSPSRRHDPGGWRHRARRHRGIAFKDTAADEAGLAITWVPAVDARPATIGNDRTAWWMSSNFGVFLSLVDRVNSAATDLSASVAKDGAKKAVSRSMPARWRRRTSIAFSTIFH